MGSLKNGVKLMGSLKNGMKPKRKHGIFGKTCSEDQLSAGLELWMVSADRI